MLLVGDRFKSFTFALLCRLQDNNSSGSLLGLSGVERSHWVNRARAEVGL